MKEVAWPGCANIAGSSGTLGVLQVVTSEHCQWHNDPIHMWKDFLSSRRATLLPRRKSESHVAVALPGGLHIPVNDGQAVEVRQGRENSLATQRASQPLPLVNRVSQSGSVLKQCSATVSESDPVRGPSSVISLKRTKNAFPILLVPFSEKRFLLIASIMSPPE